MQKRNYQKELDKILEEITAEGTRPRLLVHSCCAPCSSYVMEYLSRYFDLTMYFYNPNMDSREEYEKRAEELQRLIREMNAPLKEKPAGAKDGVSPEQQDEDGNGALPERTPIRAVIANYDPEAFEEIAKGHETDPERGTRCRRCYELRLRKTAEYMRSQNAERGDASPDGDCGAQERGAYDYFATTLTLSPLKDAEALNTIAEQIASQYGLGYLVSDFKKREGYKRSIELSREYHLYRQNYCGCRFSKAAARQREDQAEHPAG